MATPGPEASRDPRTGGDDQHDTDDGNTSVSGSSYIGSDAAEVEPVVCRWRNERYFDQECSRYFDCPSHIVERAASEHGGGDDVSRDAHAVTDDRDTGGRSSMASMAEARTGEQDSEISAASGIVASSLTVRQRRGADSSGPSTPRPRRDDAGAGSASTESSAERQLPDTPRPEPNTSSPATYPTEGNRADEVLRGSTVARGLQGPADDSTGVSGLTESAPATPVPIPGPRSRQARTHRDGDEPPLPSLPPPPQQAERPAPRSDVASPISPGSGRVRGLGDGNEGGRDPAPAIVLPRWQPDAEVTLCPICHTQFSIFVRKHHCRKCGRVVCNSCSPHRITIPFQFIVQPPGQARLPRYPHPILGSDLGYSDSNALVGGERVRLCNPCVPDPNTSPPQAQRSPHHRSQSSTSSGQAAAGEGSSSRRGSGYVTLATIGNVYSRSRSITMHQQPEGVVSPGSRLPGNLYPSMQRSIMAGTPPSYFPSQSSSSGSRYASGLEPRRSGGPSTPSVAGNRHRRSLPPPPQPQYQLAEEDECPVCHRELPRRTLPNFEALRESHISNCIITHSTYGGSPRRAHTTDGGGGGGADGGEGSSSSSSSQQRLPPPPPRRTGMFPYLATEKDCVDSAECTICLEEFEVGAPMARLECLCRFHHACISAWFVNHPGRCPVHQHDSFGY